MRNYFIIFIFCSLPYIVMSQTGTLSGVVEDMTLKETVIGANVSIEGLSKGAITDIDGKFIIENINVGNYTVKISYIGLSTQYKEVTIIAGQETVIRVELSENENLLETVVVKSVRNVASDIVVLNTIKESMQIISGLSAESIKRTLDSDASQVVKRIPGVTVMQDRFIVVRGLNERYNTTLLHNVNTPSMEPDVRSFSLDIIPSNIIDQLLIYKSPAPDLPGDFSGGAVKIFTKSIPETNTMIFDVSTGYRQGSSFQNFQAEERRAGHWTGINDGVNDLPRSFPENLTVLGNSEIDQAGMLLPNNWGSRNYNSGLDYKFTLTNSFRKNIGKRGMVLGNITSLQYSNSKTVFNVMNRAYEAYDIVNDQSKVRFDYMDTEYGQEIMVGAVHNWALKINDNNTIEFKNLYNHLTSHDFIERTGNQVAQGFAVNNFAFYNEYRGMYSGQLVGTHRFLNENANLEWIGGFGHSFNDLPDYRRYRRNIVDEVTQESVLFVPRGQTPDFLGKFYSNMNENIYSGAVNFEYKINGNSSSTFVPIVKTGLYVEERDRTFGARNLGFSRGFNFDEATLTALSAEELFAPENININNGIKIGENFSTGNFFDANNRLLAYYVSLNLPLGDKFNIFGGVRIEDNLQTLKSPDRFKEGTNTPPFETVIIDQVSVLPSLTLSYRLNSKMVFKGVYGKTVNRPEFREISPFGFYDFIFDATATGYTFLRNASIDNFDLRWEMYPSPTETVSFALFYKDFTDPIESLYGNFGSEQNTFLFRNIDRAYSRGIEVDIRKSFSEMFNSQFLNRFSVHANFSLIDSEVNIGPELSELLRVSDRPLQGQSNFIVNSGIYYDDRDLGLQINLNYNVIGKRILLVGAGAIADTYEMPRNILDLSISKVLGERLSVKVGIKDILNQEFLLLQDGNDDGVFDRQNDQIFRKFNPGTTYSIGFSYKIY